jgi:hypothetical protein
VKIHLPDSAPIIHDSPDGEKTYFRQLGRDVVPEQVFGVFMALRDRNLNRAGDVINALGGQRRFRHVSGGLSHEEHQAHEVK